jgi:manganese/zinc/iron transport system permease protein
LTRLKEDAALGIVLSVYFGAGISLLGVIQQMESGHAAGLEAFIYGKTASMGANDALLIAAAALTCSATCLLLFKELKLLCFDEVFAGARGMPVVLLDSILMALVVVVSIVGLQAVGLILMIALLVIPAAAARFWTEKMGRMTLIAGILGAAGGMYGAATSALFSKLPSGAMIVLVCTAFFLFSLVFGTARGVLVRWLRRHRLNRKIDRQHLLRAMYETLEASSGAASTNAGSTRPVAMTDLLSMRSWSSGRLRSGIRRARRLGLIEWRDAEQVALTQPGLEEAARLTHQHRLWELYLINYADTAPSHVDRDADALEHVLEPEVILRLESLLKQRRSLEGIPDSPHDLTAAGAPTVSQVDGRQAEWD